MKLKISFMDLLIIDDNGIIYSWNKRSAYLQISDKKQRSSLLFTLNPKINKLPKEYQYYTLMTMALNDFEDVRDYIKKQLST